MHCKLPKRQKGIVLVIVVAAVVMMLTLLALMVEDQHILVRGIGNQKVSEQGYQYAQGTTAWAARVLHEDKNRVVDYLGEDWAKFGRPEPELQEGESESFSLDGSSQSDEDEEEPATIDFGFDGLQYSIDDLQGRFNLNNLAVTDPRLLVGQKRIFINLLELLEIGEFDERERLYGALIDWIDENDLTNPNGFESSDYNVKSTPYHAADQKLTSMGELRFIEGFSDDIIRKLRPHVTVLPVDGAKININTTSPQLLASLNSSTVTDLSQVQAFLAAREDPDFVGFQPNQIEQAKTAIIGASVTGAGAVDNMMQVNSQFFQVNSKVTLGDYVYCMESLVLRESAGPDGETEPKVTVLNRQHNTLCLEQSTTAPQRDEDLS